MRLIQNHPDGTFEMAGPFEGTEPLPPYAILSHTWFFANQEVVYRDMVSGRAPEKTKPNGYAKIRFCVQQAAKDGLDFCWVDSCCIDKSSSAELQEAITAMFKWYRNAAKCYVYLWDVSAPAAQGRSKGAQGPGGNYDWESAFRRSRWFTRGWTLQELLAPKTVEFFSVEGTRLGDKSSLEAQIHEITGIPLEALRGADMSSFSVEERFAWAEGRQTKRLEDRAYSLLGIFNVFMPLMYGEGENAFHRLRDEVERKQRKEGRPNPAHVPLRANGSLRQDKRPVQPQRLDSESLMRQIKELENALKSERDAHKNTGDLLRTGMEKAETLAKELRATKQNLSSASNATSANALRHMQVRFSRLEAKLERQTEAMQTEKLLHQDTRTQLEVALGSLGKHKRSSGSWSDPEIVSRVDKTRFRIGDVSRHFQRITNNTGRSRDRQTGDWSDMRVQPLNSYLKLSLKHWNDCLSHAELHPVLVQMFLWRYLYSFLYGPVKGLDFADFQQQSPDVPSFHEIRSQYQEWRGKTLGLLAYLDKTDGSVTAANWSLFLGQLVESVYGYLEPLTSNWSETEDEVGIHKDLVRGLLTEIMDHCLVLDVQMELNSRRWALVFPSDYKEETGMDGKRPPLEVVTSSSSRHSIDAYRPDSMEAQPGYRVPFNFLGTLVLLVAPKLEKVKCDSEETIILKRYQVYCTLPLGLFFGGYLENLDTIRPMYGPFTNQDGSEKYYTYR